MLPAGAHTALGSMCFSIFYRGCKLLKSFHILFSGTKVVQINRMRNSLMFFCLKTERIVLQNHLAMIHIHRKRGGTTAVIPPSEQQTVQT